jgi:hypothetical protein
MKPYMLFFVLFSLVSCLKKDKTTVDSIITDATIYTVTTPLIKRPWLSDGKILAIGTNDEN